LDPRAATAAGAKTEEVFEEVTERGENICSGAKPLISGPLQSFHAIAIVELAFLWVAEDLVGFGGLFEFLLGCFVPWIPIRMILQGQLAIGLLDVLRRPIPLHP
jgi:hypothetical protein